MWFILFRDINIGVYKCGFAKVQAAYDEAVITLFAALDKVRVHFSIISVVCYCHEEIISLFRYK